MFPLVGNVSWYAEGKLLPFYYVCSGDWQNCREDRKIFLGSVQILSLVSEIGLKLAHRQDWPWPKRRLQCYLAICFDHWRGGFRLPQGVCLLDPLR
jgi:hypothetical protein